MESKKTSKREYAFVINGTTRRVEIIDREKNVLRTFDLRELDDKILGILVVHGLKQKLTDDTMISKIGEDADRLLALDDLWAQLKAGEWEKERVGVARPPEAAILFVMEKMKLERSAAEAALKAKGKDFWETLRESYTEDFARIDRKIAADKVKGGALDLGELLK